MKYTVKYLSSLSRDVERIAAALDEHPEKARRLLKEMDEKLLRLADTPFMFPIYYARPIYRKMVLKDHVLFYIVDEHKKEVRACRLVYAKMDVARQLED